eukprot:TRINITY_DN891_c0_g1_i4.p1 TRINITY_DN891_c0_g1~~TRINITY_DN891_c0_g1_i4.p1  ORF type:complete len:136 (+),score=20.50 TRINITY_DN891_c0_g1_i4:44-451(+)
MCKSCVATPFPDRGTVCLETGAYVANLAVCVECHKKGMPLRREGVVKKPKQSQSQADADSDSWSDSDADSISDNEELTVYTHLCTHCEHVIAVHKHGFKIKRNYQEYWMDCLLCGHASDSRSIAPYDPRKAAPLY